MLEAGGAKSRLAGDLGVAQTTLNKYLHATGRNDLVGKDHKRARVYAKRLDKIHPPKTRFNI